MDQEQPKQYTPEEIAEMEKSRTISDAELLKGGAEYSVNEKGEKENLLVTNEQSEKLHEEFRSEELKKAQEIVNKLFINEVKDFLRFYEGNRNINLDWSEPERSEANKECREFLFKLEKEVADKVAQLPEKERLLAEKIKPHKSGNVEGRFVCPACISVALKKENESLSRRIYW